VLAGGSPLSEITPTDHRAPAAIGAAELRSLRDRDPDLRILDVRTTGEFALRHIPGSFNVPLADLPEHVARVAESDHPVVLVCQSGRRANTALAHLTSAGRSNLRVLHGGIASWVGIDGDVAVQPERWAMERQVRGVAGSIVLGSILASLAAPKARFVAGLIGGGLLFSALSNTCTLARALARLPYNRTDEPDLEHVLAGLTRTGGNN